MKPSKYNNNEKYKVGDKLVPSGKTKNIAGYNLTEIELVEVCRVTDWDVSFKLLKIKSGKSYIYSKYGGITNINDGFSAYNHPSRDLAFVAEDPASRESYSLTF